MMVPGRRWCRWTGFYSFYPSVLDEDFRWSLVGECPRSVSGWCIWTGSRPGPDGALSVMQLPEGLYMDPSSLVDVIFCGLALIKFFISCRLGFGV